MLPMVRIIQGDALARLRELPADSVDCIVTSPPYWGLRDYGHPGQLGAEESPALFVEAVAGVFDAARRVLKPAGTLWLNLGDSYAGSWGAQGRDTTAAADPSAIGARQIEATQKRASGTGSMRRMRAGNVDKNDGASNRDGVGAVSGLKAKDLIGVPWRVAFELQRRGWWLRSDIIWAKPNPMPESVTDRPTKSHEYVFLLSKSERYFYDVDAIREPHESDPDGENTGEWVDTENVKHGDDPKFQTRPGSRPAKYFGHILGRNARTVWTIATQPFSESHFATMPPALAERAIRAGCPEGGIVLDPFFGAGTTALSAVKLGRSCVGIELNPEYAAMAARRISNEAGLLCTIEENGGLDNV